MDFKPCACCGLTLPVSFVMPIQIKYQGRVVTVFICQNCKTRKENEAKGKK